MPRELPFDTTKYVKVRGPVVDEFKIVRNGTEIAMTREALTKIAANMNHKFERTGDLCSGVIGHTKDGAPEHEQPQVAVKLHNWAVEDFADGKKAVFADHYIPETQKLVIAGANVEVTASEFLDKFPKRSAEIWMGEQEIYPVAFLGATAPERDLGTLRLSAGGDADKFYFKSPGVLKMAKEDEEVEKKKEENDTSTDTKSSKSLEAKLDQVLGMLQSLAETLAQGQPAPVEPHGAGGHDEDIASLLAQLGEEPEPKGKEKEEEPEPAPKDDGKVEKLQKEVSDLRLSLARTEIVTKLAKAKEAGASVDPNDEQLVSDLLIMPPDVQDRTFSRFPKRAGAGDRTQLDAALKLSREVGDKKTVNGPEDQAKITAHAQAKGIPYPQAKTELGYA